MREAIKRRILQIQVVESGDGYYVATCSDLSVITQEKTLDELAETIRDSVLHAAESEDLDELGYVANPSMLVSIELGPVHR